MNIKLININTQKKLRRNSKLIFFIVLLLLPSRHFAEIPDIQTTDNLVDSLVGQLKISDNDTVLIDINNQLAYELAPIDPEQSLAYANDALRLSQIIYSLKHEANALKRKGESLRYLGELEESLNSYLNALELYKILNDNDGIAKTQSDLGITYFSLADYSKAFTHFDKALDFYKLVNDKVGILNTSGYIGVVFSNFEQHDKAIKYFEIGLRIAEEIGDEEKIAIQLNNLGLTYVDLNNYPKAIDFYKRAMEMFKNAGNDFNYAMVLGNIGIPYAELKHYKKAKISYLHSLDLATELGDKYGIAHQYGNLGELYVKMYKDKGMSLIDDNNHLYANEAIKYLDLSISVFDTLDAIEDQKDYLLIRAEIYESIGDYENSLLSFKNAKALQDSIQAKDNKKIIAELEIKQDLDSKENEIKILNQENEYHSLVNTTVSILAILVLIIALLILYYYKKKKNDNILLQKNIDLRQEIEEQLRKNEVELTNHKNNLENLVSDRTAKLEKEIVEHKETEEALLLAIERAEIANNAKSVFLANMSHELRTPLVGILGYSDLLMSVVVDEDAKEMANGINRTGNRLLSTLSLVLDLARIESDKYEIDISEVDVIKELKDTYLNFKAMAKKKKLDLILDIHSDSFIQATDVGMLKVILDNLVNNAIKFTHIGEIKITSDVSYVDKVQLLTIKVSDTGVGIKKQDIPLIFEEFKQLSEGFTKDFQGSGLGLSITKKFVNLLGGNISVESEPGKGTTFTISFPAEIKAVA